MTALRRIFVKRPDPLLLIVPLVLVGINIVFNIDSTAYSPGQQRNLLQLNSSILFWMLFAFVILPYLLHFLLRASGKWDAVVCRPHIYLTIALLLIILIAFYAGPQQALLPANNFEHTAGGTVADMLNAGKFFALVMFAELLLQFLFVIYFLIRIFQRRSRYLPLQKQPGAFG